MSHHRAKSLARWTLLAAGALAFCALLYGRQPVNILRVESGIYLDRAAGTLAQTLQWGSRFFTRSYHGHYTPLGFHAELLWSAMLGPSETLWRWRQIVYLSLFSLATFAFWDGIAARLKLAGARRWSIGVGGAAVFACSPLIVEFVALPFLGLQLLWAALTMGSLHWINRAVDEQNDEVSSRALGISLALAYGSIQFVGLGLATLAGYLAATGALWISAAAAEQRRRIAFFIGAALVLAAAHGSAMLLAMPPAPAADPASHGASVASQHLPGFVAQVLGFLSCSLAVSLRSLWSPNAWPAPRVDLLASDWPYGAGVLLLLALYACLLWRRFQSSSSAAAEAGEIIRRTRVQLALSAYTAAALGLYVAMIATRIWQSDSWTDYLVNPRYLWPLALLLSGGLASALLHLRERAPLRAAFGFAVAAICATGNLLYQQKVVPVIWPDKTVSHERVWKEIVAMAEELQAAGLPLPNVTLARITQCGDRLGRYATLLRRSLKLPPATALTWASPADIDPNVWAEMKDASATFARFAKTLFPEDDAAVDGRMPTTRRTRDGSLVTALTHPALLRAARLDRVKDQPNLGVPIDVGGVSKPSIWINSPTSITFPNLPLGNRPIFRCAVSIHPAIWNNGGADGAGFRVSIRSENGAIETVGERYLNPIARPEERTWNLFELDLAKYAGRRVDLILENTPGPAGNDFADWCIWGDAAVVERP